MKNLSLLLLILASTQAFALDEIIHPYQSVRSAGMGGVLFTTGEYEENFFANPARVTANPELRVTIFDPTIEINSHIPGTMTDILGGGDVAQKIAGSAGNNNHARLEFTTPSVYIPPAKEDGKWGFAFGLITSVDTNIDLRENYDANAQVIGDIGPAFSVGRKLLDQDALSVGATMHAIYRVAPKSDYSIADALASKSFFSLSDAANGSMIDFDVGATYHLPIEISGMTFDAGAAIDNLLGGNYSNLPFHPINSGTYPMEQPRSLGFGVAGHLKELGPFENFLVAVEASDIGNNANGGLFRLIHVGAETRWGRLIPRVGVNQGYLCAGLGLNLTHFTIDFATYGEEMGLNPGEIEDRRFAIKIAFQI